MVTISVCGTLVRTKGTAPSSYSISTKILSFSAGFPIQEAYPKCTECKFIHSHWVEYMLTHNCFHSFDAKLVLERNRKTMKGSDRFTGVFEIIVDLLRTGERSFDEYLGQTICLGASELIIRTMMWERDNTHKLLSNDGTFIECSGHFHGGPLSERELAQKYIHVCGVRYL